jgi:4-hydroxysphinganine ceramide fatty acyl 2-hydroxylase
MFCFTLLEYFLHRFVFHSEKWLPNSKVIRYLHYLLHGIHHTLPNDPDRLVYPPVLFAITFTLLINCFFNPLLRTNNEAINTFFKLGIMFGYLMYDCTHYALHHVDTRQHKGSYFHRLQKYHNQHHFGG